ncbi:MAG: flavin reductase family protein [Planctomycetes bacterium]|nr:flavin reductase family protein [Planctomycetota bacterium]
MILNAKDLSRKDAYFLMIGSIVPRPIAWVSSLSAGGVPNLAPFSYFMGVSSKPALLAISVADTKDGMKDTARNILATKEFVVNLVPEKLEREMVKSSEPFPPDVSEFDAAGVESVPSASVAPRGVKGSPIRLECRLHQFLNPVEGVNLIIGEVVTFVIDDEILTDGLIDPKMYERCRPVARLGTNLYSHLEPPFEMDRA